MKQHLNGLHSGTVTFLHTDIQGSTQLLDQLGKVYTTLLADHHSIMRTVIDKYEGHEVDTQGDAFFVSFPRATQAVAAVTEIQHTLAEHRWPSGVEVRVRMGLHTGEPWLVEEGYVGMDVHRSARIAHIAHGGQVLLSETTFPLVQDELPEGVKLLDLGHHRLKDMRRPEHIHQLVIDGLPAEFPPIKSLENLSESGSVDFETAKHLPQDVGISPYRGLSAFREDDAAFFFGREAFSTQLMEAVLGRQLVAVVVGSSGSGKSSAVFAGLLPQLQGDDEWVIVQLRPGSKPFQSLAGALVPLLDDKLTETEHLVEVQRLAGALRSGEISLTQVVERALTKHPIANRLLLVIDQFEELFTLNRESEVQISFLDELLAMAQFGDTHQSSSIVCLLTLRADFMGQALAHRPFADALQNGSLMLGPMTRKELRAAIEKPAELQGAKFEVGLVSRILDDVGQEPGNLPLLEFALTLLWDRMDQGWLTHEIYDQIGRVDGALARYADDVYSKLTIEEQEQARKIFVQLVQPGQGTDDTRRVAKREELVVDWALVQHLADSRLVVTGLDQTGDETVEVVHEALIRGWEQLRFWMATDRAFRNWQEGLRADMRQWHENEQDEGDLLRGRSLGQAENWLAERAAEISDVAQRFIQASIELRDRRERERTTRNRRIFAGLSVGLMLTIILAAVAFQQRNESLKAYSMSLAAHVQKALDIKENDLALSLALAAAEIDNPPPVVAQMLRQAAYSPGPIAQIDIQETFGMDQMPFSMAVSPTKFVSLIGFHDGTLILWDVMAAEEIRRFEGHTDVIADVAFSPDGKTALSGSYDTTVILWDLETGEILQRFTGHNGWVRTVTFSPDGTTAATGGFSGTGAIAVTNPGELILWDLETGQEITRLEGHPTGLTDIEFSPDGTKLLASSGFFNALANQASLYYWDLENTEIIHQFELDNDAYDVAFSPDGNMAVSTSVFEVVIWDLNTGGKITTYGGYIGMPRSVDLTPAGDQLATIDSNGMVDVWSFPSGEKHFQGQIQLHENGSWSDSQLAMTRIALDPGGRFALTVADDNSFVIWDLWNASEIRRLVGHDPGNATMIGGLAITPDGKYALSGSGSGCMCGIPGKDNSVRFWDVATGEQIHVLEGHQDLVTMTHMTPDGKLGISGSLDGTVRVWDLEKGVAIRVIENAHTGGVFTAVISSDGKKALTGSITGGTFPDSDGIKLWDLETGEMLHYYNDQDNNNVKLIFNPDGLSAYGELVELVLLDFQTGQFTPISAEVQTCCVGFDISSDGKTIYSVHNNDTILRSWDIASGKIIQVYGAHGGNRTRVELSADDQVLFSSGLFGDLYLWEVQTGELLRTWNVGALNIDIGITDDGKLAITAGPNSTVVIQNLDLPLEINEVKSWVEENRLVRELTCKERATYSIEPLCEGELAASP